MRYLPMNKKGVSPIIATLLLIVIAVAAAVVTYAFVTGFIGTSSGSATQTGAMSVDSTSANATAGTVIAYLRNTGTKSLNLGTGAAAYINGVQYTIPSGATFNVGSTFTLNLTGVTGMTAGVAAQLRVVASDGTPVQVSIVPVA